MKYDKKFLSPDKNPGVKDAQERFARLGVVASILRNTSARERFVPCFSTIPVRFDSLNVVAMISFIRMGCQSGEELDIIIRAIDRDFG